MGRHVEPWRRSKGWRLTRWTYNGLERFAIVTPRGDTRRHLTHPETTRDCWCKPTVEKLERGRLLIGHNSADGREHVERHGVN